MLECVCPHGLYHMSSNFTRYVLMLKCMCPHALNHVSICTDKSRPVINVIHHCMQAGTYRFPEPEKTFKNILTMLRENTAAVEWLTDKGSNNVEDVPHYKNFVDALEEAIRDVALSGSRLFKKGSIKTKQSWQRVDKWRKVLVVLFVLRYVMCPHEFHRVSSCIFNHVSLCILPCVLMHLTMCPHAFNHVSSCIFNHHQIPPQVSQLQVFLQLRLRRLSSKKSMVFLG